METKFSISLIFICLIFSFNAISRNVPLQTGVITDEVFLLSEFDKTLINNSITDLFNKQQFDVYVLVVNSLENEAIDAFSQKVFNTWKLSFKSVLFVVSKTDREVRIEVGRDLTGKLSNSSCSNIIQNTIIPLFKEDNYAGGISDGILAINDEISSHGWLKSIWINYSYYIGFFGIFILGMVFSIKGGGGGFYNNSSSGGGFYNHSGSGGGGGSSRSGGGASGKW